MKKHWKNVKWLLNFDVVKCFDNRNHTILLNLLQEQIKEFDLGEIIEEAIKTEIQHRTERFTPTKVIAQGVPLSPLLMNVYLNELDKFRGSLRKKAKHPFHYIRPNFPFLKKAGARNR